MRLNTSDGAIRCDDGSYWVHVRVASAQEVLTEEVEHAGRVTDVRVDYREDQRALAATHVEAQLSPIDFAKPGPYHLAVRVTKAS